MACVDTSGRPIARDASSIDDNYSTTKRYAVAALLVSGLISGVFWLTIINAAVTSTGLYFNSAFLMFAMMSFGAIMCVVRSNSKGCT